MGIISIEANKYEVKTILGNIVKREKLIPVVCKQVSLKDCFKADKLALSVCLLAAFMSVSPAVLAQAPVPVPAASSSPSLELVKTNAPGTNVIEKSVYNEQTGSLEKNYYKVNLPKTEYGHKEAQNASAESITVSTPNPSAPDNPYFKYDVKYYVDSDRLLERVDRDRTGVAIDGDFYEQKIEGVANGGAIYNDAGSITDITGDFVKNSAVSDDYAYGGGIYNYSGSIRSITGDFIANKADGAQTAEGGAIYNGIGSIGNINGCFIGNTVTSSNAAGYGGAIDNYGGTVANITGAFVSNGINASTYSFGGAIYNGRTINGNISADFAGNYAIAQNREAAGGAIYNTGVIGERDSDSNLVGGIVNSNFYGNRAESTNGTAKGGAIYTEQNLNIIADNGSSTFAGNSVSDKNGQRQEAVYVGDSGVTLKLESKNNGVIQFDDQINGESGYKLALTGDRTGKIALNNSVTNANVTAENIALNLGKNDVFAQSDFTINSGTLGFVNGIAEQQIMKSANINGNINMAVDVDLKNEKMDTLPENAIVSDSANINVNYINLINDASKELTNIQFASQDYKSQVAYTGADSVAYSPIWKYDVSYNPENGFFSFARGSASDSSSYNPTILAPAVATQAGAYTTQLQTFNYAFQHADTFMNIPYMERTAMKNAGRYALSPTGDATDVGTFSPLLTREEDAGFWVKPYASFESVPLKNGPKVSNINYGTLVGYDSKLTDVGNGFERVLTGYIGYNGASQRYSGVDAYQNGGLLGGTATFYKGNFFNATTLSVGASAGDATGMYGSENYTMLLAGIGNKTGYNVEFWDGKMIFQPSMLISYTFVNTFDYTNGAGVRIESDPMHAIQLAPGVKLIGNTKNGWQPYIGVNMVWNLLNETNVTANDIRLPEMSIRPYVQYGVGIQKRFKDNFLAFGQAMIHNGGRNGVTMTTGLRWKVGR